jgi:Ca2+-binding EF-hand superfamily protein
MVASISSNLASRTDALFARLDTSNKGYLEKADLQAALPGNPAKRSTVPADKLFARLDSDQDGKVTKSELSDAIGKVGDQLNSQLNQSRVGKGGQPAAAPPPPPPPASDTTVDPADGNADGTVSEAEAAAYAAQNPATTTPPAETIETGLSEAQLVAQRDALPATDVRRQAALSKLADNFESADTNGDGKLSRSEGRDYLKANRPDGGRQDSGFSAFARALQSLRSYTLEPTTPAAPVDSTPVDTSA